MRHAIPLSIFSFINTPRSQNSVLSHIPVVAQTETIVVQDHDCD